MKNRITIIMAAVAAALLVICLCLYVFDDKKAPQITVTDTGVKYQEGMDNALLLEGVSAIDNMDGNISGAVRVTDIVVLEGGKQAQITYAVYDSSFNLAKYSRIIDCDASMKKEEVSEPVSEAPSENTSENASENASESRLTGEGYEDLPLQSTGAPVIRLTTHEVHMAAGGTFNAMSYVDTIVDDEDTTNDLYRRVRLLGTYNVNTVGNYELSYYCLDSDGNESNVAKLMLYVE